MDVLQALLFARIEVHAARNAAQAPEILVLQVRAVAPAEDFQGDHVLPRSHVFGNIEAGLQLAVFAVPHHFPVRLPLPGGIQVKYAAVLPHVIPLFRDHRRRIGCQVPPGITNIHVHRVPEAVELPHAGNGHFPPGGVVIGHGGKVLQAAFHRRTAVETPAAVQRQGLLLMGGKGGPHGQAVFLKNIRVLPRLQLTGLQGKNGTEGQRYSY